jgi:glyoxylase-like metal-dependent hydrolase (beta-lactamase superfamily II)
MRFEQVVDPLTNELIAYRVFFEKLPGARMVWLDGRPHPSQFAKHSWEGFSTGKFKGDMLEITTTHLKEGQLTRNGVPTSFRTTVIEHVFLDEPYLHWVFTVIDPDYLTEPLVRSGTYIRAPNLQLPPYPCQPEDSSFSIAGDKGTNFMPHYLPGKNPFFTEAASKYAVSIETMRGGANTLYPNWRDTARRLSPAMPGDRFTPVYNDASTRIAERADAQPAAPPTYDAVEPLHVAGNVYMIGGAGANIAASVGGDGVVLVDSGTAAASDKVLAAIRQIAGRLRPESGPESASPFSSTWQATHAFQEPRIRLIINTNDHPERVGGNRNIHSSPLFRVLGARLPSLSLQIIAHERTQGRLVDANKDAPDILPPTDAYFSDRYTLYRFVNNQAVQVFHMPNAVTDGDSIVWFRRSDVIATGDIYNSEIYPPIDVDKGGSVNGTIQALSRIIDMSVPEFMSQGGTMIVPGRGWISDIGDLGYYRDMIIVIRDRIQALIDEGMTLDQVRAAGPTKDYDPLYGRQPGVTSRFVESVYRSLKGQ